MPRTRHPYAPEPLPRPLLLRILSITAISLPPLLSLITFALTLKIIYTPEYAEAKLHTSTGRPNGLVIHTSPFYNCTKAPLTAIDDPTTTTFTPTCPLSPPPPSTSPPPPSPPSPSSCRRPTASPPGPPPSPRANASSLPPLLL
ncbi:hypothetical protein BFW01_g2126 [Lasiodiplodia theobromae]|nr:hypothetical protein BFW01_g2126 [Lasiodiplodia theobromae]